MEKAPTMEGLLLVESTYTGNFTFKNLLRHYAEQQPEYGKYTWNWDADTKIITNRRLQESMLTKPLVRHDLFINEIVWIVS